MTSHIPDGLFESWDRIVFSSTGLHYYRDSLQFGSTVILTPEDADLWIIPHNLPCGWIWISFWAVVGQHCRPDITDDNTNKWGSYLYEEWVWDQESCEWVDASPELRHLSRWVPRKRLMEDLLMKAFMNAICWSHPTDWPRYVQDHAPLNIARIVLDRMLERGDQSYA